MTNNPQTPDLTITKAAAKNSIAATTTRTRSGRTAAGKKGKNKNSHTQQRSCILVLGMHRSGTSALTRLVSMLGATLPKKLLGKCKGNETGHWEPEKLVIYHDRMLASLGSAWHDWMPLDFRRAPFERRERFEKDIAELIDEDYGKAPLIVLKEPRIARFAPLFLDILSKSGFETKIIVALRNPLNVIESLMARKSTWPGSHNKADAALLWLAHMLPAEKAARDLPHAVVSYEAVIRNPKEALQTAIDRVGLKTSVKVAEVANDISEFVDESHSHHAHSHSDVQLDPLLTGWVADAYGALRDLEAGRNSGNARQILDQISAEFEASTPMLATLAGVKTEAVNVLAAKDAEIASNTEAREDAEAKLVQGQAELEDLRKEAVRLQKSLDDTIAREAEVGKALVSKNAELASNTEAREDAEARLVQGQAELEDLRKEAVRLQKSLDDTIAREAEVGKALVSKDMEVASNIEAREYAEARLVQGETELAQTQEKFTLVQQEVEYTHNAYRNSRSWKMTAPLRLFRVAVSKPVTCTNSYLSKMSGKLLLMSWRFYKRLPLSFGTRTMLSKLAKKIDPGLHSNISIISSSENLNQFNSRNNNFGEDDPILFSFIIPIYDRTNLLREAIESALKQTCESFEVILVLDGSPQKTRAVVNEFSNNPKIRIFEFPTSSGNAVRGRNKGILEARGKYVTFLDSDDIAVPRRIEISKAVFDGGADVVYGAWKAKFDGTRQIEGLNDGQIVVSPQCDIDLLSRLCVPCQSTVSVRKELFYKYGFLKPEMQYREDHELWARLAFCGAKFKATESVLATLRLHAGNNELNFKADDEFWEAKFRDQYTKIGLIPKKIAFLIDGFGISGGMAVIMSHAVHLQQKGHDVSLINISPSNLVDGWWQDNPIPILTLDNDTEYGIDNLDVLIATFWTTVKWLSTLPSKRKLYLVQSDERLFYDDEKISDQVASTYSMNSIEYVVIAQWLQKMLKLDFDKNSKIVPNGIDLRRFYPLKEKEIEDNNRCFRILLEGPIDLPMKGMDDAYAAVADLDCDIWIVSSAGKPRKNWRYSKFFQDVPFDKMREIYASCDVLVKMSKVESFCLPALEAMACGCCVVMSEVDGGVEFLEDRVNALITKKGDVESVKLAVLELMEDEQLREKLKIHGFDVAAKYSKSASVNTFESIVCGETMHGV